ncbi:MAG TPA: hypothetical protein VMF87_12945 [Streptosporangiaceae bacterium]|nr:hypothetical protein [Streptosporangiaceae bacterium]
MSIPNDLMRVNGTHVNDGGRLAVANGHRAHAPRTVAALCEQFAEVCESAVDPLEIASALELEGLGDQAAKVRYGYRDVFALAQDMYFRVPRKPAEPEPPPDPWGNSSGVRPALHSLLYALPGICFPAAVTLLIGGGVEVTLIVALLAAWSLGQGLAYLGYTRLGRTLDMKQTKRVLRVGLIIGLAAIALAMAGTGRVAHAPTSALLFGAGEGVYMLGAGVLLVLGSELWLILALAPGVLGSAAFLYLGRPPDLQHLVWIGLAATPVLALLIALIGTRGSRSADGGVFLREEWIGAIPAVGFGLVAAGLLIFPVAAGPDGRGGINVGALLAALPLSLSMGAAEACLLWYRRRTQRLMRTIKDIGAFGLRARLILLVALVTYLAAAVVLMAATVEVAGKTGLATLHPGYLPQLGAYLILAAAMFLALMLQAFGSRIFPLLAGAFALAFEIVFRDFGVLAQIVACSELLIVVGGYAAIVLARTVRHAY